jgi:uncharacterized Fe-S cluster-containing radical SAM superfamily protein
MNNAAPAAKALDPRKFQDPAVTAAGEARAAVALGALRTLWFNTGTLCNLTCRNCYIESSPRNDRLAYLTRAEVLTYIEEIAARRLATEEIGFTGGEPFMNPDIVDMLTDCLERGFRVLVLTNAMRPMMRHKDELLAIRARHGARLVVRVSLDHYSLALHEWERGPKSFAPTIAGLEWLSENGFAVHVAGRTRWNEPEKRLRRGYARLFAERGIAVDADDRVFLTLFPEMDAHVDVPEITERCWGILGVSPDAMMCASSRMVVKRKGAPAPVVVPCTLLPYDAQFEMGARLADADRLVALNHPHCAKFCVLGGGSCSRG